MNAVSLKKKKYIYYLIIIVLNFCFLNKIPGALTYFSRKDIIRLVCKQIDFDNKWRSFFYPFFSSQFIRKILSDKSDRC